MGALGFIVAEADYHLGSTTAVMAFVNGYRATAGLPPFVSADSSAPGGDRCVMPDGSCVGRDYRFSWELQNEVTTVEDRNRHPGPLPDEVKEEYGTLYRELMMEIRARQVRGP